jgi:bacteriorhodopsin
MDNVQFSTDLSIIVQIITGLVSIRGIFISLPEKHKVLNEILILETVVQVVELFFYVYFLRSMALSALPRMASVRYFDWVITTPTMLITSIIYFKYEEFLEKGQGDPIKFMEFIKTNKKNVITIVVCNFMMLLFGYLGEIGVIDMKYSLIFGFIFFGITFYTIYKNYAIGSKRGKNMFKFILIVWGLYGVAAMLSPYKKNNMFNVLDIFAKNFFGLFLYWRILSISNELNKGTIKEIN